MLLFLEDSSYPLERETWGKTLHLDDQTHLKDVRIHNEIAEFAARSDYYHYTDYDL